MAQLPKITTLSHGFRILRVWWRFVYVAVLSFIVNVECISRFPSSELVSATWSSSRNAFNGIPYCLRADLRRLPEADIIRKRLRESSHAEARDPGNRYGEGRNFTIHLLWNQFASSTGAKVSMTNRTPPPLSPPPPLHPLQPMMHVKMTILNSTQMKVTVMMVSRMRQGSIATLNGS